ncbi:hypothetical protein BaRGS_00017148 [Batillaria attramentaria]|uniref:Uncharacterized protein n=1 Tax=Batillaria attramentaria TaxID=370345 RepID=A0ABD0KY08_9CAEN
MEGGHPNMFTTKCQTISVLYQVLFSARVTVSAHCDADLGLSADRLHAVLEVWTYKLPWTPYSSVQDSEHIANFCSTFTGVVTMYSASIVWIGMTPWKFFLQDDLSFFRNVHNLLLELELRECV